MVWLAGSNHSGYATGARIFNAATALGVPMSRIVEKCDSVTFCLSKVRAMVAHVAAPRTHPSRSCHVRQALGAPAGSMLCGTKEFIYHAHRWRKALGGGMRQVGVLAAPGIIALRDMPAKIAGDHARAQTLAAGLAKVRVRCSLLVVGTYSCLLRARLRVESTDRQHRVQR